MILVADSGSTKTSWRLLESNVDISDASGINPFVLNRDEIIAQLRAELEVSIKKEEVSQIYFYGAGCSNKQRCDIVKEALVSIFPDVQIEVNHDLLAAARATCKNESGIACILGTGSNSCYYDGEKIMDNVPSLGYILGDEGSGYHIGKELVKSFIYRELPKEIEHIFKEKFDITKEVVLENVYFKSAPNRYIAQFAKFAKEQVEDEYIERLVMNCFDSFIDRHILKYPESKNLKINFVGSIAFEFRAVLEKALKKRNLDLGLVIKSPIDELVSYHLVN